MPAGTEDCARSAGEKSRRNEARKLAHFRESGALFDEVGDGASKAIIEAIPIVMGCHEFPARCSNSATPIGVTEEREDVRGGFFVGMVDEEVASVLCARTFDTLLGGDTGQAHGEIFENFVLHSGGSAHGANTTEGVANLRVEGMVRTGDFDAGDAHELAPDCRRADSDDTETDVGFLANARKDVMGEVKTGILVL